MVKGNFHKAWTNKDDIYLNDNYAHEDWEIMKKHLGRSRTAISVRAHILGLYRSIGEYAVYKGEKMLAVGTVREIADQLEITEVTVRSYAFPSYRKRVKNGRRTIKL